MDWWWAAVGAAVAWTVLVALWGILTRSVANILVGVGLVMGALLSLGDERPGWHALGLAVTLLPAVGLYAAKAVTAGTAKGFGALGANLSFKHEPVIDVCVSWFDNDGACGSRYAIDVVENGGVAARIRFSERQSLADRLGNLRQSNWMNLNCRLTLAHFRILIFPLEPRQVLMCKLYRDGTFTHG